MKSIGQKIIDKMAMGGNNGKQRATRGAQAGDQIRSSAKEDGEEPDCGEVWKEEVKLLAAG
jgi:hypothetical protein